MGNPSAITISAKVHTASNAEWLVAVNLSELDVVEAVFRNIVNRSALPVFVIFASCTGNDVSIAVDQAGDPTGSS